MDNKKGTKKRTILLTILLISMILLLYFLTLYNPTNGVQEEEIVYKKRYALIVDNPDELLWDTVNSQMTKMGNQDGIFIDLMNQFANSSFTTNDYIKMAVKSDVDGIILQSSDSYQMIHAISEAKKLGVPIVTVLSDSENSMRIGYIGVNGYEIGKYFGKQVEDIIKEKGFSELKVLVLTDETTVDSVRTLCLGLQDKISENKQLDTKVTVSTYTLSRKMSFSSDEEIRELLINTTKCPDVIIGLNAMDTTCVYQSVIDYNMVGDVNILGYIGSESIYNGIKLGIIHSVIDIDGKSLGKQAYNMLQKYSEIGNMNEYIPMKTVIINKYNVTTYLESIANVE